MRNASARHILLQYRKLGHFVGLFGASDESTKIKQAKIKQKPKIKMSKLAIVNGNEPKTQVQIAI